MSEQGSNVTQPRLCVVQLVPALEAGGAERSTLEIGRALVEAGHRSIVVSAGGRMVDQLVAEGSQHIELPIGKKSLKTLTMVPKLRAILAESKADIVHARSRLPAWIGWHALRKVEVPRPHFVTTVHGLNSPGWYSSIMARSDRIICVSNLVRDHVLRHYRGTNPSRLVLIPRGVDSAEFPFGHQPDDEWRTRFFAQYPQLDGAPLLTLPALALGIGCALPLYLFIRSRRIV